MYCEKCGKQISDRAEFCGYCGSPVDRNKVNDEDEKTVVIRKEPAAAAPIPAPAPAAGMPKENRTVPVSGNSMPKEHGNAPAPGAQKAKSKAPLIIVLVVLALVLIGVGAFLFFSPGEDRFASYMKEGDRYLAELDYEEALASYRKAFEIEPNNAQLKEKIRKTYNDYHEELVESGDNESAIELSRYMAEEFPDVIDIPGTEDNPVSTDPNGESVGNGGTESETTGGLSGGVENLVRAQDDDSLDQVCEDLFEEYRRAIADKSFYGSYPGSSTYSNYVSTYPNIPYFTYAAAASGMNEMDGTEMTYIFKRAYYDIDGMDGQKELIILANYIENEGTPYEYQGSYVLAVFDVCPEGADQGVYKLIDNEHMQEENNGYVGGAGWLMIGTDGRIEFYAEAGTDDYLYDYTIQREGSGRASLVSDGNTGGLNEINYEALDWKEICNNR